MIVICGITIIKHLCKQTWTPNTEQAYFLFSSQDIESGVDSPLLADMSNAVGKSFRPGPEAAARGEYIVQFVRHLGELVCKLEHFGISRFQAGDGFVNFLLVAKGTSYGDGFCSTRCQERLPCSCDGWQQGALAGCAKQTLESCMFRW